MLTQGPNEAGPLAYNVFYRLYDDSMIMFNELLTSGGCFGSVLGDDFGWFGHRLGLFCDGLEMMLV